MDHVIDFLRAQIEKDPQPRVFFRLGEEYRKRGFFEEALDAYLMGIQQHTKNIPCLVSAGKMLKEMGKFREAMIYFRKTVVLDPQNISALVGLTECQIELKMLSDAKKNLEIIDYLQPSFVKPLQSMLQRMQTTVDYQMTRVAEKVTEQVSGRDLAIRRLDLFLKHIKETIHV
jgi:tetratricopeptide (TPR) repeat protein